MRLVIVAATEEQIPAKIKEANKTANAKENAEAEYVGSPLSFLVPCHIAAKTTPTICCTMASKAMQSVLTAPEMIPVDLVPSQRGSLEMMDHTNVQLITESPRVTQEVNARAVLFPGSINATKERAPRIATQVNKTNLSRTVL